MCVGQFMADHPAFKAVYKYVFQEFGFRLEASYADVKHFKCAAAGMKTIAL